MTVQLDKKVEGKFVDIEGERYYAILNADQMPAFFISVVSDSDHWLFVSSNGGLTAGRVSPETALFPYAPVDRITESQLHTGPKTIVRLNNQLWEPFNPEQSRNYSINRNVYKNTLGNKLCFEEINNDLGLRFRYTWCNSKQYGFVRQCQICNLTSSEVTFEVLDGLQNVLPAGTPRYTQTNSSNLVDAYKYTELEQKSKLGIYSLYSAITDRAEPCESLKANAAYCLGMEDAKVLLSSAQLEDFRNTGFVEQETVKRGIRGAYLVCSQINLSANSSKQWSIVANIEQSQTGLTALIAEISDRDAHQKNLAASIAAGSDNLSRIMAKADGLQQTNEESVSVHHYANVLFNTMRGGIFADQYLIDSADFIKTVNAFNQPIAARNAAALSALSAAVPMTDFMQAINACEDVQLERLAREYLPITFGRRHGDPSRPWNQFAIKLEDEQGNSLLNYQGNWRDIFQNWEALSYSYPNFIESVVAKFVNASTIDGFNPYRITKEGIDWEVEDPEDPWSYIGYWGDHQIIYLQKLLETSDKFHAGQISGLLRKPIFSYANVPYRIKPLADLFENAKDTVTYDGELEKLIEQRVETLGFDGKLVLDESGQVYQVNLFEKLLVPLLSKLSNLVVDGGIWLNTQRPEWNDANNALVGQGLSMVTLYYMRRYIQFFANLLADETGSISVSNEVNNWLKGLADVYVDMANRVEKTTVDDTQRYEYMAALGQVFSDYRQTVYSQNGFSGQSDISVSSTLSLLNNALRVVDSSIINNRRSDSLYHAYNLLKLDGKSAGVSYLYPMLEGQVAVLSSGYLSSSEVIETVQSLFESDIYRDDQKTFMLYPDREAVQFFEKNKVSEDQLNTIAAAKALLEKGDERLFVKEADGYRFSADLVNAGAVSQRLDELQRCYSDNKAGAIDVDQDSVLKLYEQVFNHSAFTGRSGGMFGFEGLGCIYWHMVSKLLLAVEENYYAELNASANADVLATLGELYYRVREGIGFNKTPTEYGAFPTDPYSHTPKHAGAQQPGMTGQVKEEVLSRLGELGAVVDKGAITFAPTLLRSSEFLEQSASFQYLNVKEDWQQLEVPAKGLAFTWCQVPIIYSLADASEALKITVKYSDGKENTIASNSLSEQDSRAIFERTGVVASVEVIFPASSLFDAD